MHERCHRRDALIYTAVAGSPTTYHFVLSTYYVEVRVDTAFRSIITCMRAVWSGVAPATHLSPLSPSHLSL